MTPKMISAEQLGLQTARVLAQAQKSPVLIRVSPSSVLVLRELLDDDAADDLLIQTSGFRASVRRARANWKAGRGIPLAQAKARVLRAPAPSRRGSARGGQR